MRTEKKTTPEVPDEEESKKGFHLPEWAWKILHSIAYGMLLFVGTAAVKLYNDNLTLNKDMATAAWRNDQQDGRLNRFEANQDKIRERFDEMRDDQEAFKGMLIDRLDALIEKQGRRERTRER